MVADFGEVGHGGLGGHGHNDTFSFVLSLAGVPVVVDPGSPVYTGDAETYNEFRRTRTHNAVSVDGLEMARLGDFFRIRDEARPRQVSCQIGEEVLTVTGQHRGFGRLADPVTHERRLTFNPALGRLECVDAFTCAGRHRIEQFLHFGAAVQLCFVRKGAELRMGSARALVTWSEASRPRVEKARLSTSYGDVRDGIVLIFESEIVGDAERAFAIALDPLCLPAGVAAPDERVGA